MYVKRSHLLIVILLTGSAVLGATLTTGQKPSKYESERVEAQTGVADGTRWEYCAVTKANYAVTNRVGQYWITYFKNSEFKVENVEADFSTNAALARAISKLGDEGWELVSVGPMEVRNTKMDAYYFKRPKRGNP